MEIENKNRAPTVRNIERNVPETQVDTEIVENQVGLKTQTQSGIQTLQEDTEPDANSGGKGGGGNHSSGGGRRRSRSPTPDQLKRKKYIVADADSDGSAAIEIGQSVSDAADTVMQTGGTIRTAVQKSATGIGKIHTMVKHGVRLGTARDVGKVAASIGSGIRTGVADTVMQTGKGLLKTKIDKSMTTDTGSEAIKQGLTDLRYADNARKALQNTARGSIKATRALRNMPRETKAQMQRIHKRAQKTGKAAKKSADAIRKVLSTKAGRIIALGGLAVFLSVFLLNGLLTVIVSAAASLFSWLAPDGDTDDTTMQSNIRTYISQIERIEAEKQREVNRIAESLTPEYRYDGTQITGLNCFGNRTVTPYDNYAVLAVLAVQKYRTVQETGSADFRFSENEIRKAVEQFYTLDYRYEYDYCPGCDCAKDSDCVLSLAGDGFSISGTYYDAEDDCYSVTLTGSTYSHVSSMSTELDFHMTAGGSITGSSWADVNGGAWSVTYRIGADAYNRIDWSKCYLTVDTVYCNNPNHKYLYGQVVNLTNAQVMTKAGFTTDEQQIYKAYLEQIRAIGG